MWGVIRSALRKFLYFVIDVDPGKGSHCNTEMDKHIYGVLHYNNPVLKPWICYITVTVHTRGRIQDVTFRVCFAYIVLFLALLSFCVPFCSTSRSVFIGWLDCQSSFWRHDVLPICWRASCIWGLELIVCGCTMPAYLVLQCGQQFGFDTNCLPMLNVSRLMKSCFVLCDSIYL